jgi:hypothetical protein
MPALRMRDSDRETNRRIRILFLYAKSFFSKSAKDWNPEFLERDDIGSFEDASDAE